MRSHMNVHSRVRRVSDVQMSSSTDLKAESPAIVRPSRQPSGAAGSSRRWDGKPAGPGPSSPDWEKGRRPSHPITERGREAVDSQKVQFNKQPAKVQTGHPVSGKISAEPLRMVQENFFQSSNVQKENNVYEEESHDKINHQRSPPKYGTKLPPNMT